jgi:hypothetical protein
VAGPLTASIDPRTVGEDRVATLRITNASDSAVEVVNPDLGQPSPEMNWPYSIETYRASLLMSFGFLAVSVAEESGADVAMASISTWATPILRPPVSLAPGESVDVPIPIGRFFPLEPGGKYVVSIEYGDADQRVWAEGTVEAASD